MTPAPTPKGARRRDQLITAASELLRDNGADSVRHRAVADRAAVPLAATTYYFASLDHLISAAVAHLARADMGRIRQTASEIDQLPRDAPQLGAVLANVFVGQDVSKECLTVRMESVVLGRRIPSINEVLMERHNELQQLHFQILERSEREATCDAVEQLMAIEDGAVVYSLAHHNTSAHQVACDALVGVVDVLCPGNRPS